ncbi:uncharacterized protein LOC141631740 [Silene latifolia]|uniref:uncharacterized protein LOC141631740 n=1 Tax=Silene latifolia TaxID=37657 RepID=UPI003D78A3C3
MVLILVMVALTLLFNLMDKIGFWNVRGMNRVNKQKFINFFMQNKGVGLFGLLETKIKSKAISKIINNFNNLCISTNNGYHNNGRIWILWDPKVFRIQFIEYNAQFIHMKVEALVSRSTFYFTMIYDFNSIQERTPIWDHLRRFSGQADGPCAMAGDFNCVLSATERVGGNTTNAEIKPFRSCIDDCEVVDIQATGSLFTWNNKQQPVDRIYSRLYRFMINKAWSDHFPELYANFLPEGMMDHTPCLIFSSMCWSHTIQGTPLFRVTKNLKLLKPALKALNREKFSDIETPTSIKQSRVADLQGMIGKDPSTVSLITKEFKASKNLRGLTEARDSFLAQKSKIH